MISKSLTKTKIRVRSAPSPTGRPHIGTAYNALFNYVFAKKYGGKWLVRIEDTDRARYDPEGEKEILESFHWLGLDPDESPEVGGDFGPYRQSERLEIYQKYARELVAAGAAYYCFCTKERLEKVRSQCAASGQPPMYDGCCRELDSREAVSRLKADESFVIRLKVPREGETKFTDLARGEISVANRVIDDQVLLKSDGFPTYHLAVVVDDYLMKITHIIRGEEWLSSTPKHILLYNAFGWEPPIYAHTPLLRGKDKSKLGKRHGALPISEFRKQGFLPEAILNYIARLGWTHPEEKEVFTLEEMIEKFALKDLNTTAPIFDPVKLTWVNAQHIRRRLLENIPLPERLTRTESTSSSTRSAMISGATTTTLPYMEKEGWVDLSKPEDWVKGSDITRLIGERIGRADETTEMARYFFEAPEIDPELLVQKGRTKEEAKEMLAAAGNILGEENLDRDWLEEQFRAVAAENDWKMGELCMTVRVAITGKTTSPPLFESLAILGTGESLSRLETASNLL